MPEGAFLDLMPSQVTVYAQSSVDKYGKRTHAASGTTYSARVQAESRMMRDAEGREVQVIGRVFLYGTPALTTDHKVTLPDGTVAVVLATQVVNDENGAHHTVVTVGR